MQGGLPFLGSSVVERSAVNRLVASSILAGGVGWSGLTVNYLLNIRVVIPTTHNVAVAELVDALGLGSSGSGRGGSSPPVGIDVQRLRDCAIGQGLNRDSRWLPAATSLRMARWLRPRSGATRPPSRGEGLAITCQQAVLRIPLCSLEAELPGCVLLCVAVPLRLPQQWWPGSP